MNKKPLTKSYLKSRTTMNGECWEWSGARHRTGYGELRRDKKRILAHRLSFFLWNEYWPEVCRHACDNRWCVNPEHLQDGTHADNARDRDERNRGKWATNEQHGRAKFTDEQVDEVFRLRESGLTQQEIASRMSMAQSHVSRILRKENRVKN